jgi:hypothetical protein
MVLLNFGIYNLALRIKFNQATIKLEVDLAIHRYPATAGDRFKPILKKISRTKLSQHTVLSNTFDKIAAKINDLFS